MRRIACIALLALLPLGCGGEGPPPLPLPRDAGPRMDAGPLIPPRPRGAGPDFPEIDGVVSDVEWAGAESAEASEPTDADGSELLVDFAWGTLDLNRAAAVGDPRMGWRDVATQPDDFLAFDATVAPTVCGASVCETSISLADLAVDPADSVALFARLVSATSAAFSNQTLPVDDPAAPDFITVYVTLPP